jgi:molybdate transport system substrate-binding protein
MRLPSLRRILILLLFIFPLSANAADVTVAAASDLSDAIKQIITKFEQSTGNHVKLTLGSSGSFYAQLTNGAPFEVFLSADVTYPRQLESVGLAEAGSTFVYAVGKIVVWVPNQSRIDVSTKQIKALLDPSIKKISIANPEHAPYGKAAVAAMQHEGVYDTVKTKFVFGENISQAAQFVQSGAADIGIVALSLALGDSMKSGGKYWEIPQAMYPRMDQGAVLMKGASPAARAFHEWLKRPDSREILKRFGFALP